MPTAATPTYNADFNLMTGFLFFPNVADYLTRGISRKRRSRRGAFRRCLTLQLFVRPAQMAGCPSAWCMVPLALAMRAGADMRLDAEAHCARASRRRRRRPNSVPFDSRVDRTARRSRIRAFLDCPGPNSLAARAAGFFHRLP